MPSVARVSRQSLSFLLALIVLGFVAAVAPTANADTVYSYEGKPFISWFPNFTCPPECAIRGSFVVAQPLASGLPLGSIIPKSFSFTDGNTTWTQSNTSSSSFLIGTDLNGDVTEWSIQAKIGGDTGKRAFLQSFSDPLGGGDQSSMDLVVQLSGGGITETSLGQAGGPPGTWTVPEPNSLLVQGAGLLGLLGAVRRKRLA